jgi:hypothetical protein
LLALHDLRSSNQHELHFVNDDPRILVFRNSVQSTYPAETIRRDLVGWPDF